MLHYFRDFKRLTLKQIVLIWIVAIIVLWTGGFVLRAFRPDHVLFILTIVMMGSLALGRTKARLFLRDWTPYFLFWLGYDMLRGVADQMRRINIEEVVVWERAAVGWITRWISGPASPSLAAAAQRVSPVNDHLCGAYASAPQCCESTEAMIECKLGLVVHQSQWQGFLQGDIPPFAMQAWKLVNDGTLLVKVLDVFTGTAYAVHFFMPWIVGFIFWGWRKDRELFFRFTYTLAILNLMGLVTYALLPAAPPWYVLKYGFAQPEIEHHVIGGAAGLAKLDKLLGINFFGLVWGTLNPNRFAAVPSLHGGHSLTCAIFCAWGFRELKVWQRSLFFLYPAVMWFAAVYLNHHYVIDLLWATGYIAAGIFLVQKVIYPYWIAKYLMDTGEEAGAGEGPPGKPPEIAENDPSI